MHQRIAETLDPVQRLVVLLAASNGGEPIMGGTRLQKMVFLLSDLSDEMVERCGYGAGNYGPYSEIVDRAARYLSEVGVLRVDGAAGGISVTLTGRRVAEEIARDADDYVLIAVDSCKDLLNDLPTDEVLAYVYLSYPRMAERSVARDRIMRDKERHVMSMLKKEKISAERASMMLGWYLDDVIRWRAGLARDRAAGQFRTPAFSTLRKRINSIGIT